MTPGGTMLVLLPVLCLLSGASWAATLGGEEGDYNQQDILDPKRFGGVANFSTFLLDRPSGMLFLGARDAILSVDTNNLGKPPLNITWDVPEEKRRSCVAKGKTEVDCHNYIRLLEFLDEGRRIYVCGTYAFDPQCAFLELSTFTLEKAEDGGVKMETGKGKCPFEPSQHYTAVMAGGTLYTAATSNFLGTLFDISRATGPEQERIRTERSINWLSDPEFVSSAFIQQSADSNPTGDDDKIYFFFTEVAKEYDLYTKVKVPRVARVCKSDVGGMKTLQRRWTTFLKTQLVCEDKPSGQRYNILTDVFTMQHTEGDPSSTHFYGLFTSQWQHEELSAVCVFSLSDINKVMDGPFKELKKTCENWINPEPVPTPRPGQCLNDALKAEGFESSLKLPDKVLTFVRDHPLMENSVTAAPLLVRKGTKYTKLAVTRTGREVEPRGTVLHLGTDRGELHQVEVVGQNATLLREIPLFTPHEPVNNILLHKGQALVGSPLSLARVQAEGCALYPNCEVCARARGLGCEWVSKACRITTAKPGPGDTVDDALRKCDTKDERCSPLPRELQVSMGLRLLLPCVQLSPRPCTWDHPPHRLTRQHHSDLEVTVTSESLGKYTCTCQEVGPGGRDPSPCRRAIYQLTEKAPSAGGTVATGGARHVLAIYILIFIGGILCGVFLLYFIRHRRSISRQGHHLPDNSLSSEKGRDLLGSSATPQSPSSASLLSEGFRLTEKRNGTVTSTTTTTLLSNQGNGSHHGNSYSGTLIHSNPSNGHGNAIYANCNTSSSGLKFASEILAPDMLDGRTGERERVRPEGGERESGEGNEMDEGLGDGLTDGIKGLEEELASFPMFKSPAPLAKCEESSI